LLSGEGACELTAADLPFSIVARPRFGLVCLLVHENIPADIARINIIERVFIVEISIYKAPFTYFPN
jgi:hypothetical protein